MGKWLIIKNIKDENHISENMNFSYQQPQFRQPERVAGVTTAAEAVVAEEEEAVETATRVPLPPRPRWPRCNGRWSCSASIWRWCPRADRARATAASRTGSLKKKGEKVRGRGDSFFFVLLIIIWFWCCFEHTHRFVRCGGDRYFVEVLLGLAYRLTIL